ncbi:MAG: MAE_28990/MAE_18760 family HEPN-like nuclease [Syntrophobacteraceae bacterium]
MSTFVYDSLSSLDDRWGEIDSLLFAANTYIEDAKLYNALCRSAIVLIVAHFEGFIKDTARYIIMDINRYSSFRESTKHIKKTFCKLFTNQDHCIKELIDTFNSLDVKIKVEPFIMESNSNPSPSVIERIASRFGSNNFFQTLKGSELEDAFSGTHSELADLLNRLREHVVRGVENYPYRINPSLFGISNLGEIKKKDRTLWEEFLDELLKLRHGIAHGTSLSNGVSVDDIQSVKTKVFLLQFAFMMLLCDRATPP